MSATLLLNTAVMELVMVLLSFSMIVGFSVGMEVSTTLSSLCSSSEDFSPLFWIPSGEESGVEVTGLVDILGVLGLSLSGVDILEEKVYFSVLYIFYNYCIIKTKVKFSIKFVNIYDEM